MKIHNRGNHWDIFVDQGFGLTIEPTQDHPFILADKDGVIVEGTDLIAQLKDMIKSYDLKIYTDNTKDLLVIYTDNLLKIEGYYREYITGQFNDLYIQVLDVVEFRDICKWKDLHTAEEIAKYAQFLIDTKFIPDGYYYLTPNQVPRRAIKKAAKEAGTNTAAAIYPADYDVYTMFRQALFGGMCYAPYRELIIDEPLICLDLTSAYIFDLLIELHCMSKFEYTDPSAWELYVDSSKYTSIGHYTITYSCVSNKIHCFKDIEGNNFEKGEHTVHTTMTSIDLKTFMEIANVKEVRCMWLFTCKLGHLPKYMLDEIVKQYIAKVDLKGKGEEYDLQKSIVNGIFGDCIRDFDAGEFESSRRRPAVAPQWGIWCCSYAKKNLLALATKVKGWVYSDTDSIYCFDNEYNRGLLNDYNRRATARVKEFCEEFGYDFEKLKGLGTFKIEKTIKKFKAITNKIYMYTTTDDKFHLTAAGLDQSTIKVDESLYNKPIPFGGRTFKWIDEDGYHEEFRKGIDAAVTTIEVSKKLKPQY